jgi:hypothetical protein
MERRKGKRGDGEARRAITEIFFPKAVLGKGRAGGQVRASQVLLGSASRYPATRQVQRRRGKAGRAQAARGEFGRCRRRRRHSRGMYPPAFRYRVALPRSTGGASTPRPLEQMRSRCIPYRYAIILEPVEAVYCAETLPTLGKAKQDGCPETPLF